MKSTNELFEEIEKTADIDDYLNDNKEIVSAKKLSGILESLLVRKGLKKADVINNSEVNKIYAYQLFSGVKTSPERDKVIALLMAMQLDLDEIQSVLKTAGFAPLYPKIKRDSIIIYCIRKGRSVLDTNAELYEHSEPTL